jgi:cysteine desulfurase
MSDAPPIYLDNHSTTRCDPAVVAELVPFFSEQYGNAASRSHRYGLEARTATERARTRVATWLGASPKEIVFTSGATEADNLAILGALRERRAEGRNHVVTVATEHPAVLDTCAALVRDGVEVTVLPVDGEGRVSPDDVAAALRPTTALVSVMLVNNEIGVVQPVAEIAERCRASDVWVHCDAAQSTYVPVDLASLPVDLLAVSAHKIYGPKGVGALVVRRRRPRIALSPVLYGGGHERGLRSGTLPVPLLVGFGAAAALLTDGRADEIPRVTALRDRLWAGLQAGIDGLRLNGPVDRAPNNLNVSIDGVEAAALLMALRDVVALSTGSACSSETLSPSHVLRALGVDPERAQQSVRFGIGRFNTGDEIDRVIAATVAAVARLRGFSGWYEPDGVA